MKTGQGFQAASASGSPLHNRMRTVEAADKIVVLADGRVEEEGTPVGLFAKKDSMFRRMTELQTASTGWTI